jgi:hypothetical protein
MKKVLQILNLITLAGAITINYLYSDGGDGGK